VALGVTLSHCMRVLCVCPPSRLYHVSTARRISLGGEGNALYPACALWLLLLSLLLTTSSLSLSSAAAAEST